VEQWTEQTSNKHHPNAQLLCPKGCPPNQALRMDLGVGAKRPPHGGGPGAAFAKQRQYGLEVSFAQEVNFAKSTGLEIEVEG